MQRRFFIIGCQRSGTTLTRLILESHPEIYCFDEIKAYAVLQKTMAEDPSWTGLTGFKIPRWTEQLSSDVLSDDGLEGVCHRFYNGEKILFLCRDVRDTIASMLKLKSGESNWCELWVPRIIKEKLVHDETYRDRYSAELELIEDCKNRLVGLAALYWKYKTESLFFYRDSGFPVLAVSYEQLVSDPRHILNLICAHLEIPFHENLLRHTELQHTELFENGFTLGNTDPARPIQQESVGQWPCFLSQEDIDLVARVCGDLPQRVATAFR